MSTYRTLWNVVAGVLVAVGLGLAVTRMGAGNVAAIAIPLSGIAGLYAYLYAPVGGGGPAFVATWALRIGVGAPAAVGLIAPLGPAALVPLGLFVAGAPAVVTWVHGRYAGRTGTWAARPSFATRISDQDLVLAWQSSYDALQTTSDVATKARIVQVRTMLLDELERRSVPTGRARRWVASPDRLYAARRS
jgi:hypothetical protein